jgi:outer membrane protein assembly factor BamB
MIQEKPAWTYQTDKGLNQWYGNVATYEGRVLGQWFCLDAKTGDVLWEKDMEDPNTITGVSKGIIVATTTQSGGPWTASSGIYGLSLETGDLVW